MVAYGHRKSWVEERPMWDRRAGKKVREKMKSERSVYISKLKSAGCTICGYNRCERALDFHHIKGKGENISQITSVKGIKKEMRNHKVVIFCANCHREQQAGRIEPDENNNFIPVFRVVK